MKTKKLAAVSLIAGICCLATAALANYSTANGYDALKTGIKGSFGLDNYTLDYSVSLEAEGVTLANASVHEEYDKASSVFYSRSSSKSAPDDSDYVHLQYLEGDENCNVYDAESDTPNYSYWSYSSDTYANGFFYDPSTLGSIDMSDDITKKTIRFGELFADTMVGDLKNNITYIDSTDEDTTYTVSLTSIQIPEIINAGASLLASSIDYSDSDYENPAAMSVYSLGDSPTVKSANMTFTVGSDGLIKSIDADGTIEGNGNEMTLKASLTLRDVGATVPERASDELKEKAKSASGYYDTEDTEVYYD